MITFSGRKPGCETFPTIVLSGASCSIWLVMPTSQSAKSETRLHELRRRWRGCGALPQGLSQTVILDERGGLVYDDHTAFLDKGIPVVLLIDFSYKWFHTTARYT